MHLRITSIGAPLGNAFVKNLPTILYNQRKIIVQREYGMYITVQFYRLHVIICFLNQFCYSILQLPCQALRIHNSSPTLEVGDFLLRMVKVFFPYKPAV